MSLKNKIVSDMKEMMKAKNKNALMTIRLIMAAIKQQEVDERIELSDAQVLVLVQKMIKQRRESIKQFASAKRDDLVDKEQAEIAVIEKYLPKQLTESELLVMIDEAIMTTQAKSIKEMGVLMAALKKQMAGQADMSVVSRLVRQRLSE